MHIGLIGGIGPAATDLYYRSLIDACRTARIDLDLTIAHADGPTLRANLTAGDQAAQAAIFARLAGHLAGAGAGCVAVTSIAGHFCIDAFTAISPLPVVDMLAVVPHRLRQAGWRRLGLLGTRQTMQSGMFGSLDGFDLFMPDPAVVGAVHDCYVGMALSGEVTAADRDLLFEAGRDMVARGAEAVLLAGTDLFLAFDGQEPGFRTIDAALLHVEDLALEAAR
jgi:aspartate racemase